MKKLLVLLFLLLATRTYADIRVNPVGSNAAVVSNVTINNFQSTGTVFVMDVPPQSAITGYVTFQSVNTGRACTVQMFSTGSTNTPNYSSFTYLWNPIQISIDGAAATSAATAINNNVTSSITHTLLTPIIGAQQVAIQVSLCSNVTDTTLTISMTLTPNGISGFGTIQGFQPSNATFNSNPVVVAGVSGTNVISVPCVAGNNLPAIGFGWCMAGFANPARTYLSNGGAGNNSGLSIGTNGGALPLAVVNVDTANGFAHITTNTSTTLGANNNLELERIVVNQPGTGETITVWQGQTCSGTSAAVITTLTAGETLVYNIQFGSSFCIQTSGTTAGDYTVVYKQ